MEKIKFLSQLLQCNLKSLKFLLSSVVAKVDLVIFSAVCAKDDSVIDEDKVVSGVRGDVVVIELLLELSDDVVPQVSATACNLLILSVSPFQGCDSGGITASSLAMLLTSIGLLIELIVAWPF